MNSGHRSTADPRPAEPHPDPVGAADATPTTTSATSATDAASRAAVPDSRTADPAAAPSTATEPGTPSEDVLPTAETVPFAPRTLTRAMARRITQLGLPLPKPRLRGMLHLIAFPATVVAGLLLVALGETIQIRLACTVFVLTASMLFGISAVYHRGTWSPRRALLLRRFDHANIFLIIAGTYTPLAIALLAPRQALTLLLITWGGAAVGVCFRLFWTSAPRWIYVPAYIALGWVAVFYMPALHATGGWAVVWLLLIGGLAYTAGAVMYALKRPTPSPAWFGFHEIFHTGTLIGFGCHFAAVVVAVV